MTDSSLIPFADPDFDIILMDCQMPVMDGLEATKGIRKLDGDINRIPIVAVSSGIKSMNQRECLECGMDDYVAKPLNQDLLVEVLIRNLPPDLLVDSSTEKLSLQKSMPPSMLSTTWHSETSEDNTLPHSQSNKK